MDRDWIDELLSKVEITRVISRYIPLTKKGRTHWGCCPFHHEKDPSFAVNEDKQFYHCFGCKESGNAITFVQKIESIDFIDAVKLLAEEAKMKLPEFKKENNPSAITREKKDRLLALLKEAARHYHENLISEKGAHALSYLDKRGIDRKLVNKFGLGLSHNGAEMLDFLEKKGYTKSEMKEAGIAEQRGDEYYDVFYGRVIFPIINNFSEVTGFGGRLINMESHIAVKYRNTSATPVFDKSKSIYAINLLKKKKMSGVIDYIIIAEGYMDVIALHKAGFDTAVASMGTSLTINQAKVLRNYCKNIYISYDGDSAGQTATLRGLDVLSSAGLNVKVVTLPDGLDPDELIKERGSDAYKALLRDAQTLPAFKINSLSKKYDLNMSDEKAKFAVEAVKVVKALENFVEREEYLKIIQRLTGYSDDALKKQAEITDGPEIPLEIPQEVVAEVIPKAELFVVSSALHSMPFVRLDYDVYPYLKNDISRAVYSYCINKYKAGEKPNVAAVYTAIEAPETAEFVNFQFLSGDDDTKYKKCIISLKEQYLNEKLAETSKIFAEVDASDGDKKMQYLKEMQRLGDEIRRLKTGGDDY